MEQRALGIDLTNRQTKKRVFLMEMDQVVPWTELVSLILPHSPVAKTGRPPFPIETMLRIHFLQQWYGLSDVAMEEALFDVPVYREFAVLGGMSRIPDRVSILRFRHLLEANDLAGKILETVNAHVAAHGYTLREGTAVDATLIAAPSSTKNSTGSRDPEMKQTKKGNNYYFGLKAHIGVDAETGLVHTVIATPANVHDVTQAHALLHGNETEVFADAGYQGVGKREENQDAEVTWHVAMRPGKRRTLDKTTASGQLLEQIEHIKASIRAKVEHPFRVIKLQFGHTKARYKGLAKNAAQLTTLFALSNLWMCRKRILQGPWHESVRNPGVGRKSAQNRHISGQKYRLLLEILVVIKVMVSMALHQSLNNRFWT